MITFASRQRMQEKKGQDLSNRRELWRGEDQPQRIARDRRRPVETPAAPSAEEMEIECERWDGMS